MKNLCLTVVCLLIFSTPVFAWNADTHKALWQAAIKDLDLSACDKSQIKKITTQSPVLPDKTGAKSDHNCYKNFCRAMDRVNELIWEAKNENEICQKLFLMGLASHFYSDSKDPAHQKIVETSCHSKFETAVGNFIKKGFVSPVSTKCKKSKAVLTFDKTNFDSIVNGIKRDILNATFGG